MNRSAPGLPSPAPFFRSEEASSAEQGAGPVKASVDARAGSVHIAESVAALGVRTVAALLKQCGGQSEVLREARARGVQIAEVVATQHLIGVACLLVQTRGPSEVLVHPLA